MRRPLIRRVLISFPDGTIDRSGEARMVRFKTGDLLAEDAEAMVNTVN